MPRNRQPQKPESNYLGRIISGASAFAKEMVLVLGAVLLINSFVLASFEVPTGSMENTVMIGDRVLVNKFIYGGTTPYSIPFTSVRVPHLRVPGFRRVARGDVIVFDWPGERDQVDKPVQTYYLKRCIGLPGDTVLIKDRTVFVNGEAAISPAPPRFQRGPLAPDRINPYIFPRGAQFNNEDHYGPITVPRKGMRLDISANNFDAWEVFIRREGHSPELRAGKVWIDGEEAAGYEVARDYIFAMGDNRDISLDSRFWGFVPMEDVIGTPMVVFWNWNPGIPLFNLTEKLRSVDLSRIATIIR
jgi:signal peptidase I